MRHKLLHLARARACTRSFVGRAALCAACSGQVCCGGDRCVPVVLKRCTHAHTAAPPASRNIAIITVAAVAWAPFTVPSSFARLAGSLCRCWRCSQRSPWWSICCGPAHALLLLRLCGPAHACAASGLIASSRHRIATTFITQGGAIWSPVGIRWPQPATSWFLSALPSAVPTPVRALSADPTPL